MRIKIILIIIIVFFTSCVTKNDAKIDNNENEIGKRAYEHFVNLSKIPLTSGNMQGISAYLVSFANVYGLEVIQDSALNVLIKKGGSRGRESEPPVILDEIYRLGGCHLLPSDSSLRNKNISHKYLANAVGIGLLVENDKPHPPPPAC